MATMAVHCQLSVVLMLACVFVVSCLPPVAPPNAITFNNFDLIAGTWQGSCSQTGYINPDIPGDLNCGISLNEIFSYPFSVTFGTGNSYSFTSGTFTRTGQNVSFTADRVNQTNFAMSYSGTAALADIQNGGSKCATVTWANGSPASNFLVTLVKSVPSTYLTYLEEGVREFSSSSPTASSQSCPSASNLPHYCNSTSNTFSYTCYAIIGPLSTPL